MINAKQKILIVKVGAIGDTIMMSPMVKGIKEQNPNCHITWIGGSIIKPLIIQWNFCDKFIEVDEKKLFNKNLFFVFQQFIKVWKFLFGKNFDIILIGHKDWRYSLFSLFSFKKKLVFFNPQKNQPHETEYLKMIAYKKVDYPKTLLNPKKMTSSITPLLAKPYIVLAPGGARNPLREDFLRRWSTNSYVKLGKKINDVGYNILLIGAKQDAWIETYFKELQCINLIGKTSLFELIYVIEQSKAFITHDSGPMHLAKLTTTPTIALFGPTIPEEKVGHCNNITYLWKEKDLPCCPCYDGKDYAQCTKNKCLDSITPNDVFELLLKKINP